MRRRWLEIGSPLAGALAFLLVLVGAAAPARAQEHPMTFTLVPLSDPARCGRACVEVISAEGEIVDSTPQDYLDFLKENVRDPRLRVLVFLTSPGGKVVASMKFGEMLRASGAMAVVARVRPSQSGSGHNAFVAPGSCYSACVYALMGGKKRVVPPHSVAGIHRMFDYIGGFAGSQKVYDTGILGAALEKYAGVMGVSPDLVAKAETISSDSIHIVTPAEMRRWRLAVRKF